MNFFSKVYNLMRPGATGVVHTITRKDDGLTNIWIDEHIFPGGYIPRSSEIVASIEPSGLNLEEYHRHDGSNYIRTLDAWLDNLIANEGYCLGILSENVVAQFEHSKRKLSQGQIESLARKAFRNWYFYFASIQRIFHKQGGGYDVVQFVFSKPNQVIS